MNVIYINKETKSMEMINSNMVKHVTMEKSKYNNSENKFIGLYFDDILVEYLDKKDIDKLIKNILESDEKLFETYDEAKGFNVDKIKKIKRFGFTYLKQYLKGRTGLVEDVFKYLYVSGVIYYHDVVFSKDTISNRVYIQHNREDLICHILLNIYLSNNLSD